MKELDILFERIQGVFLKRLDGCTWGQLHPMEKELKKIGALFDNPLENISDKSITTSLIIFRKTKNIPTFKDLKYVSYGLTQQIDNWKLIEDDILFDLLLQKVTSIQSHHVFFKKCYHGLLSGYFDYNIYLGKEQKIGKKNWILLREYLLKGLQFLRKAKTIPKWVHVIHDHKNLFSDEPCKRYARGLVNEDTSEFNEVCEGLPISHNSWVREEAIYERITAECRLDDEAFRDRLDRCLELVINNPEIKISDEFKKRCIASLIRRYSQCTSKPEHAALRDTAIREIGNPWINQLAWDTYVKDESARKMINSWLKRLLITDFFQILSEDGSADKRRLKYWLQFEPKIEDMWFALGPHARYHHGVDFRKFREVAKERLLWLESAGQSENNAFIMQIGQYIIVEFGAIGNACFVFSTSNLPFDLRKKVIFGDASNLKSKKHLLRLLHKDGKTRWEEIFDKNLSLYIGSRSYTQYVLKETSSSMKNTYEAHGVSEPDITSKYHQDEEPAFLEEVINFCNKHNIRTSDLRKMGGAFWVRVSNKNIVLNDKLVIWGFRYREGHGWYKDY